MIRRRNAVARTPANVMADVTTGLTTAEIFQLLVRRVAQGLRIPRCSIILAKPGDICGTVVAAYEDPSIQSLPVDLTRYPELRRALDTGEVVHVEDVATDPLYEAVRDAWRADGLPVPLRSAIAIRFELRGEPAGVFFLRTIASDAPLDQRDVGFAREIVDAAVRTLERIAEAAPESERDHRRERPSLSRAASRCSNRPPGSAPGTVPPLPMSKRPEHTFAGGERAAAAVADAQSGHRRPVQGDPPAG